MFMRIASLEEVFSGLVPDLAARLAAVAAGVSRTRRLPRQSQAEGVVKAGANRHDGAAGAVALGL
jgi:hypothetical protein